MIEAMKICGFRFVFVTLRGISHTEARYGLTWVGADIMESVY